MSDWPGSRIDSRCDSVCFTSLVTSDGVTPAACRQRNSALASGTAPWPDSDQGAVVGSVGDAGIRAPIGAKYGPGRSSTDTARGVTRSGASRGGGGAGVGHGSPAPALGGHGSNWTVAAPGGLPLRRRRTRRLQGIGRHCLMFDPHRKTENKSGCHGGVYSRRARPFRRSYDDRR